jgi:methionine-rich copper-binding protein CopC
MLDLWDRRGVKVTSMTMQRVCLLGLPVLCGVLLLGIASVRAMQMVESFPSARTVVEGRNAQYVVRFDALVNHRDSRLTIIQHDHVLRTLQPILRSDPKALTASAPRLPAGDYELHWSARSMSGETSEGSVPFAVGP